MLGKVIWRKGECDEVWTDLLDPSRDETWKVAYRNQGNTWHVLYSAAIFRGVPDRTIPTHAMSEEQLRTQLETEYLLTRGES